MPQVRVVIASLLCIIPAPAWAGGGAKVQAVPGAALLMDASGGKKFIQAGASVGPGLSILALPEVELVSANGAVKLKQMADIAKRGPLPVHESVITIKDQGEADLHFALERGIAVITNQKSAGPVRVAVTILDQRLVLTLQEPGTTVGVEVHGRYPPGMGNFEIKGGTFTEKHPPNVEVILIVGKGRIFLEYGTKGQAMRAPPGAAIAHWNNLDRKLEINTLNELPKDMGKPMTDQQAAMFQEACGVCKSLALKPLETGVAELLDSPNPKHQRMGVTILGAVDNLAGLGKAINDPKHPVVRDQAILILRSWLGRAPGQAEKFYNYLVKGKNLSEAQAKNVLRLLVGFDHDERDEPATYEALIELLGHSVLGVRELAHWHLYRLAPAGREIGFDAAASEDSRTQAIARWRALIPAGQLPKEKTQ